MPAPSWTDEQILEALYLRDHEGWTGQQVADRFNKSRNSVIGLLNRVDKAIKEYDPDGNQNGTMKPKWWKK